MKIANLGLVSEVTKGAFYTLTNHDGVSAKISENNVKYRSGASTDDLVSPYPSGRIADQT